MKGDRSFSDMDEARKKIKEWWNGMRSYYESKVLSQSP
jgi:hypothetical protein